MRRRKGHRARPGAGAETGEKTSTRKTAHPRHAQGSALAKSLGVDLASVQGTGRAGIITPDDVEAAAAAAGPGGPKIGERRSLRGYPRAMAAAMARNWTEIPHFSQTLLVSAAPSWLC